MQCKPPCVHACACFACISGVFNILGGRNHCDIVSFLVIPLHDAVPALCADSDLFVSALNAFEGSVHTLVLSMPRPILLLSTGLFLNH